MGNRVSISFKDEKTKKESITLFSHWDGMELVKEATIYIENLKTEIDKKENKRNYPLNRLEPDTIIIDFIRELTKDLERIESNYYLGRNENEGDNSDNGHHIIKL